MIGAQLQAGIYAALTADSPDIAEVYDRAPATAGFPRITIGDDQVIDDGNSCEDGWEVFADIHIWSRPNSGSKVEAKNLAAQVYARLVTTKPTVTGFNVIIAQLETSRTFRDPDGITEHTVSTYRFVLEPA